MRFFAACAILVPCTLVVLRMDKPSRISILFACNRLNQLDAPHRRLSNRSVHCIVLPGAVMARQVVESSSYRHRWALVFEPMWFHKACAYQSMTCAAPIETERRELFHSYIRLRKKMLLCFSLSTVRAAGILPGRQEGRSRLNFGHGAGSTHSRALPARLRIRTDPGRSGMPFSGALC